MEPDFQKPSLRVWWLGRERGTGSYYRESFPNPGLHNTVSTPHCITSCKHCLLMHRKPLLYTVCYGTRLSDQVAQNQLAMSSAFLYAQFCFYILSSNCWYFSLLQKFITFSIHTVICKFFYVNYVKHNASVMKIFQ